MGFEKESAVRLKAFASYQINSELYSLAKTGALIMHCLPMIKGLEITADKVQETIAAIDEGLPL